MGPSPTAEPQGFGVVVMGSSKVGKTTLIKGLLRLNDKNDNNSEAKIDNLYEYREYMFEPSDTTQSSHPTLRSRAIATGDLFVLLFSVNDMQTFNFANELRDFIVERKGNDIPTLFVGIKDREGKKPRLTRSVSYELADLVISCDFESSYHEMSLTDESVLTKLHQEILHHQKRSKANVTQISREQGTSLKHTLNRLFSRE